MAAHQTSSHLSRCTRSSRSSKIASYSIQQYFPASLEAGAGRAGDKKEDMGVDVPSVAESCSSESSAGEESDEEEGSDEESDEEEASESDASMLKKMMVLSALRN